MRIAVDGRTLGPHYPGIGRHLRGLAQALPAASSDHELFLLVGRRARGDRRVPSQLPGFRSVPFRSTLGGLPRPPRRLASRRGFDLFHATHFAAAAHLTCRVVVNVYDLIPYSVPSTLRSPLRRLAYRFLLRRAVQTADRVLTLTEAVKAELVEHLGLEPDRVVVTSAAVDPLCSIPSAEDIERVRTRYNLSERYVLNVASSRSHKNRTGLVAAWSRLLSEIPSVELVLVGSDNSRERPRGERQRSDPRVRRLGRVPERDLWPLYGGAEIYVQSSLAEGFGLPVLEAMTCGSPVCCSEIPVLAEVTGDAAIRFDPRDPTAMARSLAGLLLSPDQRVELARRGRKRAAQFRWEDVAERTWAAYEAALALGPKTKP